MDGESFRRFYVTDNGLELRWVEPWQVAMPADHADPAHAWGIEVDTEDSQTVKAYWIEGKPYNPDDVEHRKLNVFENVRRGIPTFYPVRLNLRRAEQLLKNMGLVATVQAAIAWNRQWPSGTTSGQISSFAASSATVSHASATTGEQRNFQRFRPGTILDTKAGMEMKGIDALDAPAFCDVLAAELRAIASRLNMPEFMLTADASNANYASTMVSEGPSVRTF